MRVMPIITISATYGAGGSRIAPAVAARLGLAFHDRLIHAGDTPTVESLTERLTDEQRQQQPPGRLLASLPRMTAALGLPSPTIEDLDSTLSLRERVVTGVNAIAETGSAVVLGRAAAVILAGHPSALHVRLMGPLDARIAQGMSIEGGTVEDAKKHQAETDRAWSRFVTRLFDRDPADPSLYHLLLDSTALPLETCVEMIALAAAARG